MIISIGAAWFGNVLARCSSGMVVVVLLDAIARWIAALMGWVSGAVCIRTHDCMALFLRRRWVGGRADSICIAIDGVVRKVPRIAFIAVRCAVSSFANDVQRGGSEAALRGLYQTMAA